MVKNSVFLIFHLPLCFFVNQKKVILRELDFVLVCQSDAVYG